MKQQENRSGSALIVVLGMMAVLMIMAVAFSVFMRTERSGMTNLKHALTARQTTQTAISRVMAAIDQSFVHPTNNWPIPDNNWPIPDWDPPYISSWSSSVVNKQFWQNAQIRHPSNRVDNARLLTDELSRHLSPSQLALAKNAKVDWVTVRSGVGASEATTQYGPKNDMIIARYAFLAFNTTGLLDMNFWPTTNNTDEARAIAETSFIKFVKKFVGTDPSKQYIPNSDRLGGFSSYAEMWRTFMGNTRYDYDDLGGNDLEADDVVTPDLFNTFSMSLDEVDPDGKMKLYVPQDTTESKFNDAEKKKYAKLALKKFERIFTNETSGASIKLAASPLPQLTRAQLATQALIDYIDADSKSSGGFWLATPDDPLNYPCTESVPMVNQAFAQFEITEVTENSAPLPPAQWYREWTVKLNVGCNAYDFTPPPNNLSGYSLKMDYEVVDGGSVFPVLWPAPVWAYTFPDTGGIAAFGMNSVTAPGASGANLTAQMVRTFLVKVFAKPGSWTLDGDGNPIRNTEKYPAFSAYHEADVLGTPAGQETVRMEVAITAKVTKAGDTVQQVPAPAIVDQRIRVAPGLYHLPLLEERVGADDLTRGELGWAVCLDPRFAYNTTGMDGVYPRSAFTPWICNMMCSKKEETLHNAGNSYPEFIIMRELADNLVNLEKSGSFLGYLSQNVLIRDGVFNNYKIGDSVGIPLPPISNLKALMEAFAGGGNNKIYPDVYHSPLKSSANDGGGSRFIDNGENYIGNDGLAMCFKVPNAPITSMSEFGRLVIGPWETLSLFATFAPGGEKIDFHRVSDYFSLKEARYPKASKIPAVTVPFSPSNPGGIDGMKTEEYLPALHYGKLNLNAQFKVQGTNLANGVFVPYVKSGNLVYNSEPLAAVLSGVPVKEDGTMPLPFDMAKLVAERFYLDVAESGAANEKTLMFRNISDIGNVNIASNTSPVLAAIMENANSPLDADREAFIGGVLDSLTTRGQTYTVIIRADAYSPKYGSESAQGGTTLATEYALVELWRDSEPNRTPSGAYYPDNTPTPVHSWFIRSCRFFSP